MTKPKQAIMSYVAEPNTPRVLIIACLRDTDEFGMYSTGLMEGVKPHGGILTMQLTTGSMKYTVRGEPGIDNESKQPAFAYETNIDSRALSLVRTELMPLLTSKGPLDREDRQERAQRTAHRHRGAVEEILRCLFRPLGDAMAAKT